MVGAWRAFGEEIARWRDAGREVEFWWRDDDAAGPDPALERLVSLAREAAVPLALAVVPQGAERATLDSLDEGIAVLQHGADHRNRAEAGEKKTEFSAREPERSALERLGAARARLSDLAGERWVAVLAPPWNRLPAGLVARLAGAGFSGLTRHGARSAAEPAPGLREVNTHVDLIAWRGSRGFVGEAEALAQAVRHLAARRTGTADCSEPTGWLTHHARHDEAAWSFLSRLFEATRDSVRWRRAAELFRPCA